MSIVKMSKLSIIGIDSTKSTLIDNLMKLGVVEINAQEAKMTDEAWSSLVFKDGNESEVSKLETEIAKASTALDILNKYSAEKQPLFKTRKAISRNKFQDAISHKKSMEEAVRKILVLNDELNELKATENKTELNRLAMLPWRGYNIPLEFSETKYVSMITGVVPSVANIEQLRTDIDTQVPISTVSLVCTDAEQHYLSILCMKNQLDEMTDILKQYGFNRTFFKDVNGTASENIDFCVTTLENIGLKRSEIENEISTMKNQKNEIEFLHDSLMIEREHESIKSKLLITDRAFYLDGWIPTYCTDSVTQLLNISGCFYEVTAPEKDEETPVLLQNGVGSYPFEAVTNLYALPSSKGIDPTSFFSFFYFMFFGLMLSDAVYGIVITASCFFILRKYPLEGMAHRLVKMFMFCGISTIFWGAMFGGWMGDIVTVAGKTLFGMDVSIPPLWFNPVGDPMKLLIFSLILGALHLCWGMGLKGYMQIRDGDPLGAFCDVGLWYILFIGLAIFGLGSSISPALPRVGQWMAIGATLGIIATGGRTKKGLGKITGGLGAIYGITGYLSDILSYSRLLALGLATGVIAQVINTMGALAGDGVVGAIVLIVVCLFGHTFNLAINALGSFVHSSRLQYVEFFGKFFISGGEAYTPFFEKTKYMKIVKEEK